MIEIVDYIIGQVSYIQTVRIALSIAIWITIVD